ncbi:uncharacterized protein C8Q71DRAFT_728316 [Rhodofomes roseus]|uniref:Uncharacterized protein n=1 Tax=Rhodofomes roseus TaxID=34475 RepID=A0ABQ8JYP6_9APHY|nr:uncharacterized protein C8Q71DRAFT_728316 [Rhodofomes roseus]KAH9829115.1 hypothetical protein C8Q71DRAFT_728316 [Rhodofomes roseus]
MSRSMSDKDKDLCDAGTFAFRYMLSVVVRIPASKNVRSRLSLVRSDVPATIHIVNVPPPVATSVSTSDVPARNLPAAPEGHEMDTRSRSRARAQYALKQHADVLDVCDTRRGPERRISGSQLCARRSRIGGRAPGGFPSRATSLFPRLETFPPLIGNYGRHRRCEAVLLVLFLTRRASRSAHGSALDVQVRRGGIRWYHLPLGAAIMLAVRDPGCAEGRTRGDAETRFRDACSERERRHGSPASAESDMDCVCGIRFIVSFLRQPGSVQRGSLTFDTTGVGCAECAPRREYDDSSLSTLIRHVRATVSHDQVLLLGHKHVRERTVPERWRALFRVNHKVVRAASATATTEFSASQPLTNASTLQNSNWYCSSKRTLNLEGANNSLLVTAVGLHLSPGGYIFVLHFPIARYSVPLVKNLRCSLTQASKAEQISESVDEVVDAGEHELLRHKSRKNSSVFLSREPSLASICVRYSIEEPGGSTPVNLIARCAAGPKADKPWVLSMPSSEPPAVPPRCLASYNSQTLPIVSTLLPQIMSVSKIEQDTVLKTSRIWIARRRLTGALLRAVPETIALQAITASYDAVIAVVTALRVYAINGRDWRLSIIVFMLLLLCSAYDVFEGSTTPGVAVPPPVGCIAESYTASLLVDIILYIVSIATSIAADGIVFIVTWRRTYNVVRLSREANIEVSLSSLLLRDGIIYFAISTILTSRMLLNLREASLRTNGASTSSHLGGSQLATMPDMDFARGVDAFGASWNDDEDADVDEGEFEDDDGLEREVIGSETAGIVLAEA